MKKADLIKEWIDYARNDLRAAEYLTNLHPQPVEIICFHCQQAAEKALKGYLVSIDIRPPKIHDLYQLLELCEGNDRFSVFTEEAIALNRLFRDFSIPGNERTHSTG
ncbi:MAG: HEPN domain-containing protein [Spirochaetia bacterium]|nr:HEPN domain-containing protein [Spirochaetia bacterium]